ncbi:MAG: DUF3008 family protein [Desulfovibrio sp.]|nr:DUF3008 family protein [Desulfovibrio sp.]
MPSVSQNQQEAMGAAHAIQEGKAKLRPGTPSAKIAKTMKPADVKEFASTPREGLPKKKPEKPKAEKPKVVSKTIKKVPFK